MAATRRSSGGNGFFYVGFGFCVLSLAVTFFAVLASTTYFNAMSDGVTKSIAKDMGEALIALGSRLDHKFAEIKALNEITERVNALRS